MKQQDLNPDISHLFFPNPASNSVGENGRLWINLIVAFFFSGRFHRPFCRIVLLALPGVVGDLVGPRFVPAAILVGVIGDSLLRFF